MPVTYEIDSSRQLVRTLASGLVTYRELERHVAEEEHDDAIGLAEVFDARGARTDLTSAQVRGLVVRTDALVRKGRFGALAIVTDNDVAFGMARMYQLLCEASVAVRIEVFRDLEPALAWLRAVSSTHD
jgi:2-hydroxychromene-2-carboxylate isomerase